MSNDQENGSAKGKKKRRKRSFSCPSFCFTGSAVSDPDVLPAAAAGSSKSKFSRWFSWLRFRNKKKRIAPPPPATVAAEKPENPPLMRTNHAYDEKEKKSLAAKTSKLNGRTQSHESNSISNSNLPVISIRYSGRHEPATLINSDRVQTRSIISQPKALSHVGHRPVDSGSSTIAPMFGLWVMVTTLAIMLLAGRITAMIWFCSSMYLLRRQRRRHGPAVVNVDSGESRDLDVDSGEHKKRVVLEGLLERNGKRSLAGFGGARHGKSSGSSTS